MAKIFWIPLTLSGLSLLSWLGLLLGRDKFWLMREKIGPEVDKEGPDTWPAIHAIIPARNESGVLPRTLPSVLEQDYPGELRVTLVDDHSDDGTGEIAREIAGETDSEAELEITVPPDKPEGWSGKVWAMNHGFRKARESDPELIWLTDADILHSPGTLRRLALKLTDEDLSLASIMADLRTESFWEKLLIPNFVYYFSLLYPFPKVNDPGTEAAGAAGGCVLLRRSSLKKAGGFSSISDAVIDDCALAREVNANTDKGIWLGLSHMAKSLRSYGNLGEIWKTISRSAFSQLNYSAALLAGTVIGMFLLFVVPPASVGFGLFYLAERGATTSAALPATITASGGLTWLIAGASFIPILNWYDLSPGLGLLAPLGGFLYTLMTVDSGLSWWTGRGNSWKGRVVERAEKGR